MKIHTYILVSVLSTNYALADVPPQEWTSKAKQELIKNRNIPMKIINLKSGEKTKVTIKTSTGCIIGYRINPQFNITKSKGFVMMSGEGVGECGGASGVSAMMTPKEGKVIVTFHNKGKTTEQFIVYRGLAAKNTNEEKKSG